MTNNQSIKKLKAEIAEWKKYCNELNRYNRQLQETGNALATQVLIQIYGGNRAEPLSRAYTNWRDEILNQIIKNQKTKKPK